MFVFAATHQAKLPRGSKLHLKMRLATALQTPMHHAAAAMTKISVGGNVVA
jgi:hypothetical protein